MCPSHGRTRTLRLVRQHRYQWCGPNCFKLVPSWCQWSRKGITLILRFTHSRVQVPGLGSPCPPGRARRAKHWDAVAPQAVSELRSFGRVCSAAGRARFGRHTSAGRAEVASTRRFISGHELLFFRPSATTSSLSAAARERDVPGRPGISGGDVIGRRVQTDSDAGCSCSSSVESWPCQLCPHSVESLAQGLFCHGVWNLTMWRDPWGPHHHRS